jgi:DNA replication initiation complex subunit (GINS family)
MVFTFEKIRELQRAERETTTLQSLADNTIKEIKEYLKQKENKPDKTNSDLMEIENAKNIIQDLFEKREHKILVNALYSVRTDTPVQNLLKEEEELFYSIVNTLKTFRKKFMIDLFDTENIPKDQEKTDIVKETSPTENVKKPMVKIVRDVPEFIFKDLKIYSLKKNDLVSLPKDLEDFLIKNKYSEKIQS